MSEYIPTENKFAKIFVCFLYGITRSKEIFSLCINYFLLIVAHDFN